MTSPTRSDSAADPAVRWLGEIVKRRPELAEAAAFYQAIIPAQHQAQAAVPPFTLNPAEARRKLAAGRPLLVGEELPLDVEATKALFLRLCRIVEESGRAPSGGARKPWPFLRRAGPGTPGQVEPPVSRAGAAGRAAAAREIRRAVERAQLELAAVWAALARGEGDLVAAIAAELALEAGLLRVIAENSLKPSLRAWTAALLPLVDLVGWRRGHCPACGNQATLAEITGKGGARRLRCAVCGAAWPYPRLQCAVCRCREMNMLGYIAVEGEAEKYRLQTCDHCRGYVKVVVTFEGIPVELLAAEELATLHLDRIAAERGYRHWPNPPS
jgi:hypothetical protein